jgi:histidyl-tRNA synthetase
MASQDRIQSPKGMRDLMDDDACYFEYIYDVVRKRFNQCGFKHIEFPIFEETRLFERSIGDTSDIVSKEMYTFESKSGKSFTLRPEGTASVCRSYLQKNMSQLPQPVELWYMGPFFRYERPQKGRYRQFYQVGAEILGESSPAIDAQLILLYANILRDLELLDHTELQLNSLGCKDCRGSYISELKRYYEGKDRSMCEDCISRREKNPMRLLDCKDEDCIILAEIAPKLPDNLCECCNDFHVELKKYLDELGIKYTENPSLVRGLDYYSKTVFEFWGSHKGAQNAIGGGGRYDGLLEILGGEPTPGIGFGMGVDRMILEMERLDISIPKREKVDIFVASLGDAAKLKTLTLINNLHEADVRCVGGVGKPTMKAQLKLADSLRVKYALLMGELEVKDNVVLVKDMERGSQEKVPMEEVVDFVLDKLKNS